MPGRRRLPQDPCPTGGLSTAPPAAAPTPEGGHRAGGVVALRQYQPTGRPHCNLWGRGGRVCLPPCPPNCHLTGRRAPGTLTTFDNDRSAADFFLNPGRDGGTPMHPAQHRTPGWTPKIGPLKAFPKIMPALSPEPRPDPGLRAQDPWGCPATQPPLPHL